MNCYNFIIYFIFFVINYSFETYADAKFYEDTENIEYDFTIKSIDSKFYEDTQDIKYDFTIESINDISNITSIPYKASIKFQNITINTEFIDTLLKKAERDYYNNTVFCNLCFEKCRFEEIQSPSYCNLYISSNLILDDTFAYRSSLFNFFKYFNANLCHGNIVIHKLTIFSTQDDEMSKECECTTKIFTNIYSYNYHLNTDVCVSILQPYIIQNPNISNTYTHHCPYFSHCLILPTPKKN